MTSSTSLPMGTVLDRLRGLNAELVSTTNKHDRALALIGACITEGINVGSAITQTLNQLGYNKRHVGRLLVDFAGNEPGTHPWFRGADHRYHLHHPG